MRAFEASQIRSDQPGQQDRRDLVFTKEGQICSSSSNLPAYGIEDGKDAFVCLDPTGGEGDRLALGQKTGTPTADAGTPAKR